MLVIMRFRMFEWRTRCRCGSGSPLCVRLVESVRQGCDEHATVWQHAKGKLTAFERIELLLDTGSFTEIQGLRRHRSPAVGLDDRRPYGAGAVCG
ncbi:carboxyl transferase domain-containing protein, partial [Nocardia sp. JMUB6875]|uniref:carboxyl transferase domain-containing protein n=1 Tax=Nocardia sp. JMUB6875 TaxID=3158170 RepID=UPI0034E88B76